MLGNHDDRANFLKVFDGPLEGGFVQHSLIQDGQHFLFLDTLKGGPSSAGLYDEPRRKWLRAHWRKQTARRSTSSCTIRRSRFTIP